MFGENHKHFTKKLAYQYEKFHGVPKTDKKNLGSFSKTNCLNIQTRRNRSNEPSISQFYFKDWPSSNLDLLTMWRYIIRCFVRKNYQQSKGRKTT